MASYFVTGTDTDVGKTVVSALLVRQLKAHYWKPVQSGTDDMYDRDEIIRLAGLSPEKVIPSLYELKAPLSPHEAAAREGVEIDESRFELPQVDGNLVIEGAGGVLVPLNNRWMIVDLIKYLGCEAIVVARSGLGTINHTLLTLELLRSRQVPIKGVIMNGPLNPANKKAIADFGGTDILAEVPFFESFNSAELKDLVFKL